MNAYKVAVTVTEDGTVVLRGLPLPAGQVVEVIVLEGVLKVLAGQILRQAPDHDADHGDVDKGL